MAAAVISKSVDILNGSGVRDSEKAEALATLAGLLDGNASDVWKGVERLDESFEEWFGKSDKDSRLHLFRIMMQCSSFNASGVDILSANGDSVGEVISVLASALASASGNGAPPLTELKFHAACARILSELSFPETYFTWMGTVGDTNNVDMKKLLAQFDKYITVISEQLVAQPILDRVADSATYWLKKVEELRSQKSAEYPESKKYLNELISNSLLALCNVLLHSVSFSGQLRTHLATGCHFTERAILPYTNALLGWLEVDTDGERVVYQRSLLFVVNVLSFVCFNIKLLRPYFRKNNFTTRLLSLIAPRSVDIFASIVRLNLNIEFAGDPLTENREAITSSIKAYHSSLSSRDRHRLLNRLDNPTGVLYNIKRSGPSFQEISFVFSAEASEAPSQPPTAVPDTGKSVVEVGDIEWRKARKKYRRHGKGSKGARACAGSRWAGQHRQRVQKRWAQVSQGKPSPAPANPIITEDAAPAVPTQPKQIRMLTTKRIEVQPKPQEESEDGSDLTLSDESDDEWSDQESAGKLPVVPPAFLCSWTKQLLLDPVLSPYGHVFERLPIEEYLKECGGLCPITGQPLQLTDLWTDPSLIDELAKVRLRGWRV